MIASSVIHTSDMAAGRQVPAVLESEDDFQIRTSPVPNLDYFTVNGHRKLFLMLLKDAAKCIAEGGKLAEAEISWVNGTSEGPLTFEACIESIGMGDSTDAIRRSILAEPGRWADVIAEQTRTVMAFDRNEESTNSLKLTADAVQNVTSTLFAWSEASHRHHTAALMRGDTTSDSAEMQALSEGETLDMYPADVDMSSSEDAGSQHQRPRA